MTKDILQKIWTALRKPAFAFAKHLAKGAVTKGGDWAQAEIKALIAARGPDIIDTTMDSLQFRLISAINRLPFVPEPWRAQATSIIQEQGDICQAAVRLKAESGKITEIDQPFDAWQNAIIEKINRLEIK